MIERFTEKGKYEISSMDTEAIIDMLFELQLEISKLRTRIQAQEKNANHSTCFVIGGAVIALMVTLIVWIELGVA